MPWQRHERAPDQPNTSSSLLEHGWAVRRLSPVAVLPLLGDEFLPQEFMFLWVHNKLELLRGLLKLGINCPLLDLKTLVFSRGFVDQLAFPPSEVFLQTPIDLSSKW